MSNDHSGDYGISGKRLFITNENVSAIAVAPINAAVAA